MAPTNTSSVGNHNERLLGNLQEVINLFRAVKKLDPTDKVDRDAYETILKSTLVLSAACWEVFVEDLVKESIQFLIREANGPEQIPKNLKKLVADELKQDKHELKVWELAGDGWKKMLLHNTDVMIRKYTGTFNTPKAENIIDLFQKSLGIVDISRAWSWNGISSKENKAKLNDYVKLRGSIAHQVRASTPIKRSDLVSFQTLIVGLAITSSNMLRDYLTSLTKKEPWDRESAPNFGIE